MARTNTAFALLTLGQWCRNHGVYEIRDVLAKALHLAQGAESSELLAAALEEASIAADVMVCPTPLPAAASSGRADESDEQPVSRGKRRTRVESGRFRGDDPSTTVNEAWEDNSAPDVASKQD